MAVVFRSACFVVVAVAENVGITDVVVWVVVVRVDVVVDSCVGPLEVELNFVTKLLDEVVPQCIPVTDAADLVSHEPVTPWVDGTVGLLDEAVSAFDLLFDVISSTVVYKIVLACPDIVELVVGALEVVMVESSSVDVSLASDFVVLVLVTELTELCGLMALATGLRLPVVERDDVAAAVCESVAVSIEGVLAGVVVRESSFIVLSVSSNAVVRVPVADAK